MVSTLTPENLIGAPMKGKRGAAYLRYKKLEDDRTSWRSHWMEISDHLVPRRGRYLIEGQNTKGRKRNTKIIDNTGGQALNTLAAGMMSGLTSPARPWFRLRTRDEALMDAPGVSQWLGQAEMELRKVLASSNFYNSASTVYTELGAFGTAALLRRQHPQRLLHYRNFTAGEYVIAENEFGEVDTIGRHFTMTVSQIVEQFVIDKFTGRADWKKLSKAAKGLWDRKAYDETIEVIHMIQPRRKSDIDPSRRDGKSRKYADLYMELGADDDIFLQEDGYSRFPAFVPRWNLMGGDVWGTSPGMESLGDIKQLQHQQRRKAQGLDKLVNPPMVAATSLRGKPTTVLPGGTTYVDSTTGGGFAPAYQINLPLSDLQQDIMEVQERIQRGFYADLFAMMINSDRRNITATEVVERHEEKLVLLGPVLQRLNTEFLDPLIEDAFIIVMERGVLPPPPEALLEADIDVKYVSLLAQAQEAVAAQAIERTFAFAGNLSAVVPDIMDNLDTDASLRQYSEILGNGPYVMRPLEQVQKLRADRAAAAQRQAAMEQENMAAQTAQTGAQAAKVLSEADTQKPNALTSLIRGVA
jgi:hypothetical protein